MLIDNKLPKIYNVTMKTRIFKALFYVISLGYALIGVFFLDWSFRMVPFASNVRTSDIIVTVAINSCYIVIGAVLFVATFLTSRKKNVSIVLYQICFWCGVLALTFISIFQTIVSISQKISSFYLGDIVMYFILFIPAVFIFINHKRLISQG